MFHHRKGFTVISNLPIFSSRAQVGKKNFWFGNEVDPYKNLYMCTSLLYSSPPRSSSCLPLTPHRTNISWPAMLNVDHARPKHAVISAFMSSYSRIMLARNISWRMIRARGWFMLDFILVFVLQNKRKQQYRVMRRAGRTKTMGCRIYINVRMSGYTVIARERQYEG